MAYLIATGLALALTVSTVSPVAATIGSTSVSPAGHQPLPYVVAQDGDSTTDDSTDSTTDQPVEETGDAATEGAESTTGQDQSESTTTEEAETTTDDQPAPTVIAKRGDRGSVVRDLQNSLSRAGFSPGTVDGIYGRLTQAAVVAFQTAAGLTSNGVYDQVTADALSSYEPPSSPTPATPALMSVGQAQQRLAELGFNPGPIDGIYGRLTRAALESFQRQAGIPVTGQIDSATVSAMATAQAPNTPAPMSVGQAQQRLAELGFNPGPIDGIYGRLTRAALESFQRQAGIPVTGQIDSATVSAMATFDVGADNGNDDGSDDAAATAMGDIQRKLANGPFDPGPADGQYGTKTKQAIWALEKLAGIAMNGQWSDADQAALNRVLNGSIGGPKARHSRRWVEIDLSQQLVMVYDPGQTVPVLVSHISSGSRKPWRQGRFSGNSITPVGSFTITRRISGWRVSSLGIGSLYNPLYFYGGIALHGSRSVPTYPASHGCVRVPMHIAEYLPGMLPNGTPVEVRQ